MPGAFSPQENSREAPALEIWLIFSATSCLIDSGNRISAAHNAEADELATPGRWQWCVG